MQARETATDAAAAAAGMTPFGGAAAAAAQAQSVADQAALNAEAKQKLGPAQQQAMAATTNMTSNIAAQMQANPRQARLVSLAEQKNCR
jgi:Spy/CpxP family protein refolding chaperone